MPEGLHGISQRKGEKMRFITIFLVIFHIIFMSTHVFSAVIFSEDYDKISVGWTCHDKVPLGWTHNSGCHSDDGNGILHACGEVEAVGRTGNAIRIYRRNSRQAIRVQYTGEASSAYIHVYSYDQAYGIALYEGIYTIGSIRSLGGRPCVVQGRGTSWLTNIRAGDLFHIDSDHNVLGTDWKYKIGSVDSNTQFTFGELTPGANTYGRTNNSGAYTIYKRTHEIILTTHPTLQQVVDTINGFTDWSASLGKNVDGGEDSRQLKQIKPTECKASSIWLGWNFRNGYCGSPTKVLSEEEWNNHYREVYFRWYMKIPPQFDVGGNGTGFIKLSRAVYTTTAGGSGSKQWYFNFGKGPYGTTGQFSNGYLHDGGYRTTKTITEMGLNDGEWHCLEIHFKPNSTNTSDGQLNIYVDGVNHSITRGTTVYPKGVTNANFGFTSDQYIRQLLSPGLGNLSGGYWDFPDDKWYSIDFDDFVVSTTYIGPVVNSPSNLPSGRPAGGIKK
jgi:hypothetical protein